jgi:hypothetical protein
LASLPSATFQVETLNKKLLTSVVKFADPDPSFRSDPALGPTQDKAMSEDSGNKF